MFFSLGYRAVFGGQRGSCFGTASGGLGVFGQDFTDDFSSSSPSFSFTFVPGIDRGPASSANSRETNEARAREHA